MKKTSEIKPLLDDIIDATAIVDELGEELSDYSDEVKAKFEKLKHYMRTIYDRHKLQSEKLEKATKEVFNLKNELRKSKEIIKNKDRQYEQLYEQHCKALDKMSRVFSTDELRVLQFEASNNYSGSWATIEEQSRNMLGTALYLYQMLQGRDGDFSPVIIEYCRVFENEMKRKIFLDFLEEIRYQDLLSNGKPYDSLLNASTDNRPEKPEVTLMVMAKSLKCLNESTKYNQTAKALESYLREKNWDKRKVTEAKFTQTSVNYADGFRNTAAHPERIMKETEAEDCARQTEQLVEHFISCMPTN